MRVSTWCLAVLWMAGLPSMATAQAQPAGPGFADRVESHWLASGFVGSAFAEDADEASIDFGGTIG
jgi:hypothetical protein